MKNETSQQNHYKSNIPQIKVNKKATNINTKNNSPSMVPHHQENNYYYNTKINSLILQEVPSNNRIQNIYQPPVLSNKSILIEYDFLANNVNNIISEKKKMNTLYKKNTSFHKFPITVNIQKKINEIEINNFYNKDNVFKDINGFNYININRNIKKNNKNTNLSCFYEIRDKNMNKFYRKNTTDEISTNSYKEKNNKNIQNSAQLNIGNRRKNYFNKSEDNNISNNSNSKYNNNNNSLQRSLIINNINNYNNKCPNFKKIPIKQEKAGNYYLRSPEIQDPGRSEDSHGNRKIMSKNRYKSPEIILSKYKINNDNFSTIKNDNEKTPNVYKSGFGFYKRKEETNNGMNNNKKYKNKTSDNFSKTQNTFKSNNNKAININCYDNNSTSNPNNIFIENSKILNPSSDIYLKIKPQNYKFIEVSDKSKNKNKSKTKENISNSKRDPIENKLKKINNIQEYIGIKLLDYNSIKKNIEDFCEILEQLYFIFFKKSYNYFIKQLISFNKNKCSNRSEILRRFKDGKKHKLNNIKVNNSMINKDNKNIINNKKNRMIIIENEQENQKEKENKNNEEKKGMTLDNNNTDNKTTTKFVELKNNIANSMMKINQDNYIKIFNDIFNKQRIENKRCRSPLVNRGNIKINDNSIKDSFDDEKNIDDKYNTNANFNVFFHKKNNFIRKFNNLKIKTDILHHNNNSMHKKDLRTSLNKDDKIRSQNTSIKGHRKKIFKMKDLIDNNDINTIENININSVENNYEFYSNYFNNNENLKIITKNLDNKYFNERNQKCKINSSLDPSIIDNIIDSDNKYYKKLNHSKNNISIDKNSILYSKPLLKKSSTKYKEKDINNNNISELEPKRKERNMKILSGNNFLNRSLNSSKILFGNELQNVVGNPEKKYFYNMNEIIAKNAGTEDKRLHVSIKYVNLENPGKKNKEKLLSNLLNIKNKINYNLPFEQNQLVYNHIDSVNLISTNKYNNKFHNSKKEKIKKGENSNILKKDNNLNIKDNIRYINKDENKKKLEINEKKNIDKKKININLNNNTHKIIASLCEEEYSKEQILINNNSNNSIEEIKNNYINEEIKNSTNYLISLLQNRYDDNKKSILYNFFKNLRKIKTNSLLLNSVKLKEMNKIKDLRTCQTNIKNFDEDKNNKNDNNNNSNQYYTKITKKNENDLNEKNTSTKSNTRNKEIKNIFNIKNKKIDKEDNDKKIYNNTQDINNLISTSFKNNNNINNISFNFTSNNINNKNEDMKVIKKSLLDSIQKLKEEVKKIKNKEKYENIPKHNNEEENKIHENENIDKDKNQKELNENKKIEDENEKLKKIKLAKLGKLFNNLNKENNIINAIKEQFLDWTSKNDFPIKNKLNKDDNKNNENTNKNNENDNKKEFKTYRQYKTKTFDIKSVFNKDNSDLKKNEEEDNKETYEEFKRKLRILRNKLIIFFLNIKNEVNDKENDSKNEKQNKYKSYKNKTYKDDERLINKEEKV